jgi:hypothetical protein
MEKYMHLKLPSRVTVRDYHEFDSISETFKQIGLKVKVKEIGFAYGDYIGIVYTGRLADPKNAVMVKSILKESIDADE